MDFCNVSFAQGGGRERVQLAGDDWISGGESMIGAQASYLNHEARARHDYRAPGASVGSEKVRLFIVFRRWCRPPRRFL